MALTNQRAGWGPEIPFPIKRKQYYSKKWLIPDPEQEMDMMGPEYLFTADNKEAMGHVVPERPSTNQRCGATLSFSCKNYNGLKSTKYNGFKSTGS